jgi:hypothetical protein
MFEFGASHKAARRYEMRVNFRAATIQRLWASWLGRNAECGHAYHSESVSGASWPHGLCNGS